MSNFIKLTCWIFFLFPFVSFSQKAHPHFINFTTSDGLPSAETFGIAQDTFGIIWFGSENGLTNFDGYNFKTYSKESGLDDLVTLYVKIDKNNKVWVCTLSGRIYYLDQTTHQVHPFKYNHIIQKYKDKFTSPSNFYLMDDQFIIVMYGFGTLVIDNQGDHHFLENKSVNGLTCYNFQSNIFCASSSSDGLPIGNEIPSFSISKIPGLYKSNTYQVSPTELLWYFKNSLYYFKNNKLEWQKITESIKYIIQNKNKNIAIFYDDAKEIKLYENVTSIKEESFIQMINGITVNSMTFDKDNSLWVSTSEQGLFYAQNIECLVFDKISGLEEETVTCITSDQEDIIFGLRHGAIYSVNPDTKLLSKIPIPNNSVSINYDLVAAPKLNKLYRANYGLSFFKDEEWVPIKIDQPNNRVHAKKLTKSKNTSLWAAGTIGFSKININTNKIEYYSLDDNLRARTFCVFEDSFGKVWVSNSNGLFNFSNHKLIPFEKNNPLFQSRIEDIRQLNNGKMVFASKGNGIVVEGDNDVFYNILVKDGLTSNFVDYLYIENSSLWACTQQGLNHLQFQDNKLKTIRKITKENGLPTNEVSQVLIKKGMLWIATSKGLAFMHKDVITKYKNKVKILDFSVNQDSIKDQMHLSYKQNNVNLKFRTIDYSMNGKIPYRFRLLPTNKEWNNTTETSINFFSLQPNSYTFEIQSQNNNGSWSQLKSLSFVIKPPYWESWWFVTLLFLSIIGSVSYFADKRIKKNTREHELKEQLNELERSALQAQMNPHFIFNCLNSIQNLILKDEKKQVIYYLGQFAKLVRKNLNFSRSSRIRLEEDIAMIKTYLEMEKLRFKSAFDYEIIVDKNVQTFLYEIPPMLVQPFVENAIIHGISQKKKNGIIKVRYQKIEGYIKVIVSDNGDGFETGPLNPDDHTSVGMKITSERLKLLDQHKKAKYIEVTPVHENQTGEHLETKVNIFIALNETQSNENIN